MKYADRKKFQRQFKVGDEITWGTRLSLFIITKICEYGVHVRGNGYQDIFVSFAKNGLGKSGHHGPIVLWSEKDKVPK